MGIILLAVIGIATFKSFFSENTIKKHQIEHHSTAVSDLERSQNFVRNNEVLKQNKKEIPIPRCSENSLLDTIEKTTLLNDLGLRLEPLSLKYNPAFLRPSFSDVQVCDYYKLKPRKVVFFMANKKLQYEMELDSNEWYLSHSENGNYLLTRINNGSNFPDSTEIRLYKITELVAEGKVQNFGWEGSTNFLVSNAGSVYQHDFAWDNYCTTLRKLSFSSNAIDTIFSTLKGIYTTHKQWGGGLIYNGVQDRFFLSVFPRNYKEKQGTDFILMSGGGEILKETRIKDNICWWQGNSDVAKSIFNYLNDGSYSIVGRHWNKDSQGFKLSIINFDFSEGLIKYLVTDITYFSNAVNLFTLSLDRNLLIDPNSNVWIGGKDFKGLSQIFSGKDKSIVQNVCLLREGCFYIHTSEESLPKVIVSDGADKFKQMYINEPMYDMIYYQNDKVIIENNLEYFTLMTK